MHDGSRLKLAIYQEFFDPLSQNVVRSKARSALRATMLDPVDEKETFLDKMRAFFRRMFNVNQPPRGGCVSLG